MQMRSYIGNKYSSN